VGNGVKVETESASKVAVLFDTSPGVTYKLQSSTDMKAWSDVGTTTYAGDGGVIGVEIDMPTAATFWRAVEVK
jgi:hypothetical protein